MRDRSQAVHVNSNESASTVLKFGVPQGSVLGPKIFIDYAKDVSEIFTQHDHSQHLFAGDMQCLSCGKPAEVPYMVTRIENCVADCQTSHYSPESWCSDGRRVIDARPRLATGADMLFSLTPSTLSASSARPRRHGTIGLCSRTVTTRLL